MTASNRPRGFLFPIIFSILGMILMFAGLILDVLGPTGVAATEYCEAFSGRLVRQPANSWSNLGFIAVGWIIALQPSERGVLYKSSFYPVFLSFMAVFLGVGSFAYHASTTKFGWFLDAGSMFLLSSFMLSYALKRLWNTSELVFSLLFVIGLVISIYMNNQSMMFPGDIDAGSMVFGLFLVLAACLEVYMMLSRNSGIEGRWAVAFILTFIISIAIWSRSRTGGVWCDPGSLLQGHAVWHLLDALCVYFIYRFYRSEQKA